MTTSYLGSLLVDSGRMSIAAGVSLRGWKPGLSLFTKFPIVDNLNCQFGMWHIVRNRKDSWINDVFGLIHSSELDTTNMRPVFVPTHSIMSFQTWGKLHVGDTMYLPSLRTKSTRGDHVFRNSFDIHPGKWSLIACAKENCPAPDRTKHETSFFLIYPYTLSTKIGDISPVQIGPTAEEY